MFIIEYACKYIYVHIKHHWKYQKIKKDILGAEQYLQFIFSTDLM